MPNRRVALILLAFAPVVAPAAPIATGQDLSWYVESLCPDDGNACTEEEVVYGECRHVLRKGACPDVHPAGMDHASDTRTAAGRGPRGASTSHALRFDGVDDIVTVRSSAMLPIRATLTLEAWVRPTHEAGPCAAGIIAGKDGGFLLGRTRRGTLEWALNVASQGLEFVEVSAARVPAGVWSHVALTYDGARVRTFVNGFLLATQDVRGSIHHAAPPLGLFRIGGRHDAGHGAGYFAGAIDDVRLWNVARAGGAIAADRTLRLRGTEPGLVGYWRLDEGRGLAAVDAAGGHAGIIANGTRWVDGRPARVSAWL